MAANEGSTYPNHSGKYAFNALFEPEENIAYVRSEGQLDGFAPPEGIVICYQRQVLEHSRQSEKFGEADPAPSFRGIYTLPSTSHRIGVLGGFGFGSPVASLLMEDFIALGTTKFISIGTAGALQQTSRVGDIVLCERAIRDEGVSHHYLAPGKFAEPSPHLTHILGTELASRGIECTTGCAWTIDTPYRETIEEIHQYQQEGVACVDMEAAALFSVASCRSVHVASAFVISDLLSGEVWQPHMRHEKTGIGLRTLCDAAVSALLTRG